MKISATPHQELNRQGTSTPENIIASLKMKKDVFGRNIQFERVGEKSLPEYVLANREKFSNWLLTGDNQEVNSLTLSFLKFKHYLRLIYRAIRAYIRQKNNEAE